MEASHDPHPRLPWPAPAGLQHVCRPRNTGWPPSCLFPVVTGGRGVRRSPLAAGGIHDSDATGPRIRSRALRRRPETDAHTRGGGMMETTVPPIELAERLVLLLALVLFFGLAFEEVYKRDQPEIPG